MNAEATERTQMPPFREWFGHWCPAARAHLGCASGIYQHDFTSSFFRFGTKDTDKLSPSGITDAFGQRVVLYHVFDAQILHRDNPVCIDEAAGHLVVEVPPSISDPFMVLSHQLSCFATAVAALLSPGEPLLCPGQGLLGLSEIAGVGDVVFVAGGGEGLQSHINADFSIAGRQGVGLHHTGEHGVPPATVLLQGECLRLPFQGTMQFDLYSTDTRQSDLAAGDIQCQTMFPQLGIGEAIIAVATLEAGITGLVASLDTAEEGFECSTQAIQNILEDLGMDFAILWPDFLDRGELSALTDIGDGDSLHSPGISALLKASVVKFSDSLQGPGQALRLTAGGIESILKCLSHLSALLLLNIVVDNCCRDIPCRATIIRMSPQSWQFSQDWKLLPQDPRTLAFDGADDFVDRLPGITSEEEMNMVWLNIQRDNLPTPLQHSLVYDLLKPGNNISLENSLAPFGAPDQVIDHQMGMMAVNARLHMYKSIILSKESQCAFTTWLKPDALGAGVL